MASGPPTTPYGALSGQRRVRSGMHPHMESSRPLSPVDLLTELLQGYRHPAAATDGHGAVIYMNAAALAEGQPRETTAADARDWPPLAMVQVPDGQTFMLRCPGRTLDATALPARALPPRLEKIARLVIDGLTDKQIASRVGLTFSTVRTYVRQIYRRMGVHNRVALVHAARAETRQA